MAHLVSKLNKAKGHGTARHGVDHWWMQRLTAIALIPLTVWFVASLLTVLQSPDPFTVADWLGHPLQAFFLLALLLATFWHAKLGLQVVIEDYIKNKPVRYTLLVGNTFLCVGATILSVLAVLRLHMFTIVSGF